MIKGIVTKIESKDYYVLSDESRMIRCSLPGKIKNKFLRESGKLYKLDIVTVGDFVEIALNEDGTGSITKIFERRNHISRKAPKIKGGSIRGERYEQIIAANVDNLFVVASITEPNFNNRLVDRIIVAAESSKVNCSIIINKIDLGEKDAVFWKEIYESVGYNVFCTSAKENIGLEKLKEFVKLKVNIFWGSSGVGKSSILNNLFPNLLLKTGNISEYSLKGKHTTVTSILCPIDDKTSVIDTPGIREIDPFGIQSIDLSHYFIDFAPYTDSCKFNTCTHFHEPGCAVIDAVEKEKISIERYESYLNILNTVENGMNF